MAHKKTTSSIDRQCLFSIIHKGMTSKTQVTEFVRKVSVKRPHALANCLVLYDVAELCIVLRACFVLPGWIRAWMVNGN